jgi:tetratricopeptide (TPR) repeat protein
MTDLGANGRGDCPSAVILDLFLAGALPAGEAERVEQHVEGCPACAANLAGYDDDLGLENLLRAPSETPLVSIQEADDILEKIRRPTRVGAAGRRADRRFRFTERVVARGGMGVIHEGLDIEMGRTVAVKRLNDEHAADRRNIRQFEHEARVTGLLEHPGIVPVYGRGKDPAGRPFYAMRMVEGERLATAVKHLHEARSDNPKAPELRRLLSRFVTVCNTVAYAHTRGFAHLDLKPSNIVLGPFGETFTMDWGLVMKVDRPVRRSSGTAHYMSPEQREGRYDQVGPASDVYALGGVLYTIVTGRRPAPSEDSAAPGDATGIPGPLHAICRKAMDIEPENRYASPLALADDVERWLADEPVTVLPESSVDRIARWMRRHRSATMATLLVVATIMIAAVVTTVIVSLARAGEHRARMRAESRADLAIEAVRKFREAVDTNLDVRNRPDLAGLRKKLLGEPLKFFEQLRGDLQEGGDTGHATTLKLGKANLELAILLAQIGSKPDAVQACQEAIATLGPLEALTPVAGDRHLHEAQTVLAEVLGRLGLSQRDLGNVAEARASLRRALAISSRLARDDPAAGDRVVHARTLDRLALIESPESPETAVSLLEQAVAQLGPIADDGLVLPADPDLLALVYIHLGSALKAQGRWPEAADRIRAAIAAYEALIRQSPENPWFRGNLATASFNLANLQLFDPKAVNVRAGFERARDLLEELAREFPSSSLYRDSLVATYGTLGVLHRIADQPEQARAALDRSREIGEGLVREHPTVIRYRSELGKTYLNLGGGEGQAGRHKEAVALLEPARALRPEVLRARPGDRSTAEALATACGALGSGLFELGRYAEALEAYRECADLEVGRKKDPRFPPNRELLKTGLLGMARCCLHLGRVPEAAAAAEQLGSLWDGDPAGLVSIARELTLCSVDAKDRPAAGRYADRAVDFLRKAVAAGYRDVGSLRTVAVFNSLRSRADFADLTADMTFPGDPFARDGR